jgi:molybdopterin molybdotransferase
MISVDEALDVVRAQVRPLPPSRTPLAELLGLRLAEPVTSRVDSPPFDKSTVDGFAVAAGDPAPTLRVTEMVVAGGTPRGRVTPGTTIRIMTGAPLPAGADAVAKVEDCELVDDETIRNPARGLAAGTCVLRRGASFRQGETVLPAGKRLGPLDIALLAEIGQADAVAAPRPRVGVLPTGDELVAVDAPLGPGQIRNSNGPMLLAALAAAGYPSVDLGVGRDDERDLREKIARGLECDVLLISGGVSAGVKDLVPGVLAELGAAQKFHQVRVKPGKPLWFGVRDAGDRRTLVFGLPGNPVSTLVTFQLFVQPALRALAGDDFRPQSTRVETLTQAIEHRGKRPTYHPARRRASGVEPLDWQGSADLATLTRADCLAVLPEGDYRLDAGAAVQVLEL